MAAKRTAELIPLCHPLMLTAVEVEVTPTATGRRDPGAGAHRGTDRGRDGGAHRGDGRGAHRLRHAQGRGQDDGDRPRAARREAGRPVGPLPAGRRCRPGLGAAAGVTILVSIQQEVAAWQVPPGHVERIRQALPQHDVRYATTPEARAAGLAVCDVAFTWLLSAPELAAAPRLRWLHSPAVAAGTCASTRWRRAASPSRTRAACRPRRLPSTSSACCSRSPGGCRWRFERQREARWSQAEFTGPLQPETLRGQTPRRRRPRLDWQRGGPARRRVRDGRSSPCAATPAATSPPGVASVWGAGRARPAAGACPTPW